MFDRISCRGRVAAYLGRCALFSAGHAELHRTRSLAEELSKVSELRKARRITPASGARARQGRDRIDLLGQIPRIGNQGAGELSATRTLRRAD